MKNSARLPNAPLNNPWVMFGEKQRAGQFNILNCCSIITPITALLFAGHATSAIQIIQLNSVCVDFLSLFKTYYYFYTIIWCVQKEQQELADDWDDGDNDLDELDEDELIRTCHALGYGDISQELLDHNRTVRAQRESSRMRKKFVVLKLDDFVGFIVDDFVAQLIVSCRNKLQVLSNTYVLNTFDKFNAYFFSCSWLRVFVIQDHCLTPSLKRTFCALLLALCRQKRQLCRSSNLVGLHIVEEITAQFDSFFSFNLKINRWHRSSTCQCFC